MKDLSYYMAIPYRLEVIPDTDEGGFVVRYPELPGALTTGETVEQAVDNAVDAKREWLVAALEDGFPIPEPTSAESFSGQFKLRLPKSLHKSLSEHAQAEGISMNQYCVFLLAQQDARAFG